MQPGKMIAIASNESVERIRISQVYPGKVAIRIIEALYESSRRVEIFKEIKGRTEEPHRNCGC